jgi:hypothetical protein
MLLMLGGCYTFTISQTPAALEPGRTVVGAAGAGALDLTSSGGGPLDASVYVRHGFVRGLDAGLRVSVISLGATGDVKYQVAAGPVQVAADLGVSYGRIGLDTGRTTVLNLSPALLVGDDRIYGGFRVHYLMPSSPTAEVTPGIAALQMLVGTTLGKKLRVIPELGLLVPLNSSFPSAVLAGGCGVQYGF